jgi:hypothetical protein
MISIGEASDSYRACVNARQMVERQVSELSVKLREAESDLRQLREHERRALAKFEQAVEDAE